MATLAGCTRSVDDAAAVGTERDPDAEFLEPARHRVRHDAVEPDDGEHQRTGCETLQQQRHEPLPGPTYSFRDVLIDNGLSTKAS